MNLTIDPDDPTPPYEQLRRQVAEHIDTGTLAAGDRLPPVRQLAGDLGLAKNTVARAYRELEDAGLLVSCRGAGTRVSELAQSMTAERKATLLVSLAAAYVTKARTLGFSDAEIRSATGL